MTDPTPEPLTSERLSDPTDWTTPENLASLDEIAALGMEGPIFTAIMCEAVPQLLREIERLRESERSFAEALGYGDGKTEPAATLAELIDPLQCALSDGRDHMECPIQCELCGEMLAATRCPQCNGGGCLPNEALAYMECGTCASLGRIHEGCAEQSYADLVARAAKAEAALERVRQVLAEHPGSAWDSGIKLQAALKAALDGE